MEKMYRYGIPKQRFAELACTLMTKGAASAERKSHHANRYYPERRQISL